MTERTLEALTDEEWEMIEIIRENKDEDGFKLLRRDGAWKIELKSPRVPNPERGTGTDFDQAWSSIINVGF